VLLLGRRRSGIQSSTQLWRSLGAALSTDNYGNLFVADTSNLRIRKITPDGIIRTVAGNGVSNEDTGDGGAALAAQINYAYGVAADNNGNFCIGDGTLRKVSSDGIITTLKNADGSPVFAERALVVDKDANLQNGYEAADASKNLYIADFHTNTIWTYAPDGTVTAVAGNGTAGFSGDGGPATSAQLNGCVAVAVDAIGDIYVADSFNYRIRIVTPDGISPLSDQTNNAIRVIRWQPN
jgi:hypothetical protein